MAGAAKDQEIRTSVTAAEDSNVQTESDVPPSKLRRFFGLFWTRETDPRERKYIKKLDAFLFTQVMLGYFIKWLDQSNYSNAFVSGMKQDLHLYGNERNLMNTYFNIGMIVGSIPCIMIQIKFIRPSIWIPSCEVLWSILVMGMAGAKDIYVLRFFTGLIESAAFPGYTALLGSYYGPNQLAKRVGLFEQCTQIAGMFGGYLQAALYTGLNGRAGLAGWRWLFIFDGIISIPIAVWGYFALPDLPTNTRAFYFTKEDREYGLERIEKIGRKAPTKFTLKSVKKIFTSWYFYGFIFPYLMVAEAASGYNYFNLWLSAEGYSTVRVNTLPTIGNAISIVAALFFGTLADRTGHRKYIVDFIMILTLISNILLTVWHIPKAALFFAFYLGYVGLAAQPLITTWGQEITQHDAHIRQLLVAGGNVMSYTFSAWLPVVVFPTQDAPHYKYAYQILIMFSGLGIFSTHLLGWLHEKHGNKPESPDPAPSGEDLVDLSHQRQEAEH